ncbi:Na/Pi cotransporter family protein [Peptacetobacter sp.]|uniref:Na/Pi cotransporter family protein n=1 Tax=Peptacetobacter sp. TaxID=2991975 RepID=UPI002E794070|nr:Na/Pi cotransporter family protein [Peptacetobacter sp.]MEE0450494.1 Na/Pi cotransporter family protein [Peptacetobacter sp.]
MQTAITLLGGLGMFLYGMTVMGEGLQKAAGSKLKKIIEMLTSNVVMGVLVGTVVTGIIQSSSATTVMVVGFVNAGIMSLSQAIGVIMGANIGTTVTAQLVSFSLEDIAPIALGIGIIFYMFTSKEKTKQVAEILIGFGLLFTGMEFMKEAVEPLSELASFRNALLFLSKNPLLGILAGFAITGIVQSSSASMGMLIALASQGLVPITAALPILYGDNIGTCVTSLISSLGASRNAKRAAVMHLSFNVIGTLLFMLILNKPIVAVVQYLDPANTARQIANAHTLFNLINVIILLPFSKYIVKLAERLVPIKEEEIELATANTTKYIDERMFETPSIALGNTVQEVVRMGEKARKSFTYAMEGLITRDSKAIDKAFNYEKTVNTLHKSILDYLLKLSNTNINSDERIKADLLFHVVNDLERISDHAENIAEIDRLAVDGETKFSDIAKNEINEISDLLLKNINSAIEYIDTKNHDLYDEIEKTEEEVNMLVKQYRNEHMKRLSNGVCTVDSGILFLDLLTNFERISDHCSNIAEKFNSLK